MSGAERWVRVAAAKDIPPGELLGVEVAGRKIAVFHLDDDTWHAIDNVCTHAYALLSDGWLDGDEIECPLHAGRFDVRTGRAISPPVEEDVQTYEVRLEGSDLRGKVPT